MGDDGDAENGRILLTGATGYVGGRLAPRLLDAGHPLRCLARSPGKLADLGDPAGLTGAMRGCSVAYYLVHSMVSSGRSYASRDREMALTFSRCAAEAGIRRILYLGGLGEMGEDLSEHLRSRREVESALASGPVPVTVLRAAMIIGSGSASFEILRYLVERLPVMVTPKWVRTECQPIGIRDVLGYLAACLEVPETAGRTLDIGGTDVVTYRRLMEILAEERGLRRRLILPVPVLTPRLSSRWIHLVTPLGKEIARPLAEGLRDRAHSGRRLTSGSVGQLPAERPGGARVLVRRAALPSHRVSRDAAGHPGRRDGRKGLARRTRLSPHPPGRSAPRRPNTSGVTSSCDGGSPTKAPARARNSPPDDPLRATSQRISLSWALGLPCQDRYLAEK